MSAKRSGKCIHDKPMSGPCTDCAVACGTHGWWPLPWRHDYKTGRKVADFRAVNAPNAQESGK